MSLFNIAMELNRVDEYLTDANLEDSSTLARMREDLISALLHKTDGVVEYYKSLDSQLDVCSARIKELQEVKKSIESKQDNFKKYVNESMKALGKDELKGSLHKITFKNNPPSLNVIDEEKVPDMYWKEKIETVLDKKALLDFLKNSGECVEYASIKQEKRLDFNYKKGV